MTGTSDFLPFATGSGANVESQATWATDAAVTNGFSSGIASSAKFNKAIRQGTFIAAGVAQWVANAIKGNVPDDGNLTNLVTYIGNAVTTWVTGLFSFTLANPGSASFPGGLIVKWGAGTQSGSSGAQAVTFGTAFPNSALISFATNGTNAGPPTAFHGTGNLTASGLTVYSASSSGVAAGSGVGFNWLVIGH